MPTDNPAPIPAGGDVAFPQAGPAKSGTNIVASSSTQFQLNSAGTFQVTYFVTVDESAQLVLTLGGTPIANTVSGRSAGTNYIAATVIIVNPTPGALLTLQNPSTNSLITLPVLAGGTNAVSAHLDIIQLA